MNTWIAYHWNKADSTARKQGEKNIVSDFTGFQTGKALLNKQHCMQSRDPISTFSPYMHNFLIPFPLEIFSRSAIPPFLSFTFSHLPLFQKWLGLTPLPPPPQGEAPYPRNHHCHSSYKYYEQNSCKAISPLYIFEEWQPEVWHVPQAASWQWSPNDATAHQSKKQGSKYFLTDTKRSLPPSKKNIYICSLVPVLWSGSSRIRFRPRTRPGAPDPVSSLNQIRRFIPELLVYEKNLFISANSLAK